jgi:protein O-mannosyl-transferase
LPSLGGASVWDDHHLLMNNTRVAQTTVRQAFTSDFWGNVNRPGNSHISHYRPLALLAYSALLRVFDADPVAIHGADLFLHALATSAFFFLLSGLNFDRRVCRVAALLFAIHPLHVEAVGWISGMSETLAAAMVLASLAFYVHGKRAASFLFAAGAMLTKESALVIPALIFVLEWWRNDPSASRWRKSIWAAAMYVPLAIIYLVLRALVIPPTPPGQLEASFAAGYRFIPAVAGRYFALLFFPWPMSLCYDLHSWTIPVLGFAIVAAWIAIVWKATSLRRQLLLAGALAIIFLSVPVATSPLMLAGLEVQDRYAYLATTGACLALAVVLNTLGTRKLVYGCLALIPLAIAATLAQERVWQTEEALWTNAVKVAPSSELAHNGLFFELLRLQRPVDALHVCQEDLHYHADSPLLQECRNLAAIGEDNLRKSHRVFVVPIE